MFGCLLVFINVDLDEDSFVRDFVSQLCVHRSNSLAWWAPRGCKINYDKL